MLGRVRRFGLPREVRVQAATGQVLVRVDDPSGLRVELAFAAGEETGRFLRCWGL
jgi:hypothetical protein